MAKAVALSADDLTASKKRPAAASRQRGEVPSADLIPMQFRMPPEFVRAFKIEAAKRDMKLNALLKYCFDEIMKKSDG